MSCKAAVAALDECKLKLGLLPKQCYPMSGYSGECDKAEYELKRCLAFAANERDAAVLYDVQSPRAARVAANARLQSNANPTLNSYRTADNRWIQLLGSSDIR